MRINEMFANQTSPSPAHLDFVACNFSQEGLTFDGEGTPIPVRIWPADDLLPPGFAPPRRLVNCNCTNCRFGDNVELINCQHTIVQKNANLSTEMEVEVDGQVYPVPRKGLRVYGYWDPILREMILHETPKEIEETY